MSQTLAWFTLAAIAAGAACAPKLAPQSPLRGLEQRTGVPARTDLTSSTAIPPGVNVDDGVSQEEAVALALWNALNSKTSCPISVLRAPISSRQVCSAT